MHDSVYFVPKAIYFLAFSFSRTLLSVSNQANVCGVKLISKPLCRCSLRFFLSALIAGGISSWPASLNQSHHLWQETHHDPEVCVCSWRTHTNYNWLVVLSHLYPPYTPHPHPLLPNSLLKQITVFSTYTKKPHTVYKHTMFLLEEHNSLEKNTNNKLRAQSKEQFDTLCMYKCVCARTCVCVCLFFCVRYK